MAELIWHRSLYWRIALGFVALLATLLVAQGIIFLWLTGRAAELLPGRSPTEYAQTIAADVAASLPAQPGLDIDAYLNERYQTTYRPFVVAMRDGRTASSQRIVPPPVLARAAVTRLMIESGSLPKPGPGFPGAPERGRGAPGPGRGWGVGGVPGAGPVFASVIVNGHVLGMVAVTSEPRPLTAVVRAFGPTLGLVAVGLLLVGTSLGALLIFRPTHNRLRSLQQAAQAIGRGQAGVRAVDSGGDEVAMLAATFNEMAAHLEQRAEALVAADESRRQLLADVSHELMTPLAAIRGYVETVMMSDVTLDEPTRARYLAIVSDETERMEHVIGDLLDLARVEGGGGVWQREPVAVSSLFERILHRHDPVLRDKAIVLERTIAANADEVVGDANRLEQALQNLAANALRHTPRGGRIHLAADRVEGGVLLVVEDSGPGIPAEHLPHIFDRFYKADVARTGTAVRSGSGLGLSIARAIVRRHGGRVAASSGLLGGARLELLLPDVPPEGSACR